MLTQVGPQRWADLTAKCNKHLKEWAPPPATAKAALKHKSLFPVTMCRTRPRNMLRSQVEEEVQYLKGWLKMADEAPGQFTELQRLHRRYAVARLEVLRDAMSR